MFGDGGIQNMKNKIQGGISIALIAIAIGLIVVGVFNGSARDVLYKAINICTECIGLG